MDVNSLPESGILVLGGGPCGGTVALGLRRLGYTVTLVTEPRSKLIVEGFTDQALNQMGDAGFSFALRQFPELCEKQLFWNGQLRYRSEHLCNWNVMESDISLDLQSAGVHVIEGNAGQITAYGSGYQVDVICGDKNLLIPTSFLVEARGRLAPMSDQELICGGETLSLQYFWRDRPLSPQAAFESFSEGYAWLAACHDGSRFAQLTIEAGVNMLLDKQGLKAYCQEKLSGLRCATSLISGVYQDGVVSAQVSTASLCVEPVSTNWIRVGDAAIAFDPITEGSLEHSLACAMKAPSVINILIKKPDQTALVCQYYRNMLKQKFYTANRCNSDFYAQEQQWSSNEFWKRRNDLTEEFLSREQSLNQIRVKSRPRVRGNNIVTEEDPLPEMSLSC